MSHLSLQDNIPTHFLASTISGFLATAVSTPVDITKTRIQTMKVVNGVPEYSGVMDVVTKIIKQEGVPALWKGKSPPLFWHKGTSQQSYLCCQHVKDSWVTSVCL